MVDDAGLSNFVKFEPALKIAAQYMKGMQYCDIMLRVPMSAAEVQEECTPEEIVISKMKEMVRKLEEARDRKNAKIEERVMSQPKSPIVSIK